MNQLVGSSELNIFKSILDDLSYFIWKEIKVSNDDIIQPFRELITQLSSKIEEGAINIIEEKILKLSDRYSKIQDFTKLSLEKELATSRLSTLVI